jgi:hypothetical protein
LRGNRAVANPAVPLALDEITEVAASAPEALAQVPRRGHIDAVANLLSVLAREALLVCNEIPSEGRKMAAKGIIIIGLGKLAAAFFLGQQVELIALIQSLPGDFAWLRQVIEALRASRNS